MARDVHVVEDRLYLTADGSRLVAAGDPEARTLYATPGTEISTADAERFGLTKSRARSADKSRKADEDK